MIVEVEEMKPSGVQRMQININSTNEDTIDRDNMIVEVEEIKSSGINRMQRNMNSTNEDAIAILRSLRDVPPAHFSFKVESFSLLSKTSLENFESDVFDAGGYKWRLSMYPKGNAKRNGNDHVSLYLVIADTKDLPSGWEVFVTFKFFVFDHTNDKFLTVEDGKLRRFNNMRTEWGFDRLLPLSTFNDLSNGYLDVDSCIFGAEVFVHKYTGRAECLSIVEPKDETYTWTIHDFSTLQDKEHYSDEFTIGERKWKLRLYPKGYLEKKFVSFYLEIVDLVAEAPVQRVYAEYKLRIKDQTANDHVEMECQHWFSASSKCWGCRKLLPLRCLNDPATGYKLKNIVIVEAEIKAVAVVKSL